jgi:hypothetical protein
MRTMVFALATAGALGVAVPAGAQTVYVDNGYRAGCSCPGFSSYGYRSYGYDNWGTARADVYVNAPRARVFAYDDAPRYRYRAYSRDWDEGYAYAYSGRPYGGYRDYRRYDGPSVSVGFGFGGWDRGYDHGYWGRDRW